VESAAPSALFEIDWREQINRVVNDFLSERGIALAGMVSEDIDALLRVLVRHRLFEVRNAAAYIANILGCSRATLYARLKQVRGNTTTHHANTKELPL
jgi:predicted transcriptional regulator YheO